MIDVIGSTTRNDRRDPPQWFELNEVALWDEDGANVRKSLVLLVVGCIACRRRCQVSWHRVCFQVPSAATITKLIPSDMNRASALVIDRKHYGQSDFVRWSPASKFAGKALLRFTFKAPVTIVRVEYWTTNMESFGSNPGIRAT